MSVALALFTLGQELVLIHERGSPGTITIVPVIVDDLQLTRPVLTALCSVMQGCLLDTSDPERAPSNDLHSPVPATDDPVRREAVAAALVTTTGRRVVLVDSGQGLIDAKLENPPAGEEPSAGDRAITAVARAVGHRELDHYEFAIIAYQADLMDLPFRRAVWHLVTRQLPNVPHDILRTLVVVSESAIDLDLHCQTNSGFRFAVQGSRLLERQGAESLNTYVTEISRREEPFVLFLGAGFAASSRLPLGDPIRDTAIRRLLGVSSEESPTSEDLAIRFHRLLEDQHWLSETEIAMPRDQFVRKLTLERVITAERRIYPQLPTLDDFLRRHDDAIATPGSSVRDLGRLLRARPGRVIIVEVNFDLLLEQHVQADIRVFASEEDFSHAAAYVGRYLKGEETAVPVLKIHGTISDFSTCVVSEEQTEQGLGGAKLATLRSLLPDGGQRLWVYVGVSMRDRDVLLALSSEEFARGLDEIWVSPYLVETIADFAQRRTPFWREGGRRLIENRLITEKSDAFFSTLAQRCEEPP